MRKKQFKIQNGDNNKKQTIEFSRSELKHLHRAVLIDFLSEDIVMLPLKNLLEKLEYHITEDLED